MSEHDWLECNDLGQLLGGLGCAPSERKLRLFAVACCQSIWGFLTDDCSRQAIWTAARFADSTATRRDLADARRVLPALYRNQKRAAILRSTKSTTGDPVQAEAAARAWAGAWDAARSSLRADARDAARDTARAVSTTAVCFTGREIRPEAQAQELQKQVALFRCIFGSPFRPVTIDQQWLTSAVVALAHVVYEEVDLPCSPLSAAVLGVLADALEEAGCTSADILAHLRSPELHARGCWPLDLLLRRT